MAIDRGAIRRKHHLRVRRKVSGSSERPRLCIHRSLKHISVQVIDDTARQTIVSASTMETALKDGLSSTDNIEACRRIGEQVARRALEKGVEKVVFDRAGYVYHGRVKAVADAARAAGLQF